MTLPKGFCSLAFDCTDRPMAVQPTHVRLGCDRPPPSSFLTPHLGSSCSVSLCGERPSAPFPVHHSDAVFRGSCGPWGSTIPHEDRPACPSAGVNRPRTKSYYCFLWHWTSELHQLPDAQGPRHSAVKPAEEPTSTRCSARAEAEPDTGQFLQTWVCWVQALAAAWRSGELQPSCAQATAFNYRGFCFLLSPSQSWAWGTVYPK